MDTSPIQRAPPFDLFSPTFQDAPYSLYRALRASDPVHRSIAGVWVVSRYADVSAILHDARFGADLRRWSSYGARIGRDRRLDWLFSHWILNRDAPEHAPLRALLGQAFSSVAGPHLEIAVARIARELCDAAVSSAEPPCIVRDFAHPLPTAVIHQLFGIPEADRAETARWSRAVSALLEPVPDAPTLARAAAGVGELARYLGELYERRRRAPGDDVLSRIGALAGAHGCSPDGIIASSIMLFTAGSETTINLLGNAVLSLLRAPEARAQLQADPGLWRSTAIDELLRYESPVQSIWRNALSPASVSGRTIAAGEQVLLLLGSANRDPEQFADPDRLDPARAVNRHLALGGGSHYCLGAAAGRLQARTALQYLLARFPEMRLLDGRPRWKRTISSRSLEALPVDLGIDRRSQVEANPP